MSNNRGKRIPMILSIPDKIKAMVQKLLKLRYPLRRTFSGRRILCSLLPVLFLVLLHLIPAMRAFLFWGSLLLCLVALAPQVWNGVLMVREKQAPLEEITLFLSTALAVLLRESDAAVLIPACAGILQQTQAYVLLHRDAELEKMQDFRRELRLGPEKCDAEKSAHGAVLASAGLGAWILFAIVALALCVVTLFHIPEAAGRLRPVLTVLILSGPAAVLYSSVFLHFAVFCSAAKKGIALSDDRVPEEYAACRLFVFSKTGTVTDGRYVITDISPVGVNGAELLRIAALAEYRSEHPIAKALKQAAGLGEEFRLDEELLDTEEIQGKGVSALIAGKQIYVGNAALLEEHGIWFNVPAKSGSALHVAVNGEYWGYLMISDTIRDRAFDALEELREQGASMLVMLTGDVRSTARSLASSLNFDMVKPELTPEEKASAVRYLRSVHGEKARIVCVGDGTHDAPMFQQSDIAVCMNAQNGSPAEVNLYEDDLMAVPCSYRICRRAARLLWGSIAALAAVKLILLVLGLTGVASFGLTAVAECLIGCAAAIFDLTAFSME